MIVNPVARRSVTDQLYEQLLDSILAGDLEPGSRLPSERDLTVQAGVNRQAVREVLQRLRQMGLVGIVHGDGVHVLDWRTDAGLPLLPDLLVSRTGTIDPGTARSFMELRTTIGSDAARLCAERSNSELVHGLEMLVDAVEAGADDPRRWGPAAYEFWEAVLAGSGNVAFQLSFNTLRTAVEAVGGAVQDLLDASWAAEIDYRVMGEALLPGVPDLDWMLRSGHRQVVEAIGAHDGDGAASTARRIFELGTSTVIALLGPGHG